MLPDRVSNPGPLTYESGALPIALRGPARGPPEPIPFCSLYYYSLIRKGYPFTAGLVVFVSPVNESATKPIFGHALNIGRCKCSNLLLGGGVWFKQYLFHKNAYLQQIKIRDEHTL